MLLAKPLAYALAIVAYFPVLIASAYGSVIDSDIRRSTLWDLDASIIWERELDKSGPIVVAKAELLIAAADAYQTGGTAGGVMACYSDAGILVWKTIYPFLGSRIHDIGQAIQSKPFIDGERGYYINNRGELICLKLDNIEGPVKSHSQPSTLWKLDMSTLGVFKRDADDIGNPISSPLVAGNIVYCVTGHGHPQNSRAAQTAPSFLAVDKLSGQIIWSSNAPGNNIIYGQWSSPVAVKSYKVETIIFPGGDGYLYGFAPLTGELIWSLNCNDTHKRDWFGPNDLKNPESAKDFFVATPTVSGSTLYIGLSKGFGIPSKSPLLAIDLDKLSFKWTFNSPLFKCTHTSAIEDSGIVFVISENGILFALDSITGVELWHSCLEESPYLNAFASPLAHKNRIYVCTDSGVVAFESSRVKKVIGHWNLPACYPHTPVISGERMYISTGKSILAIRLR